MGIAILSGSGAPPTPSRDVLGNVLTSFQGLEVQTGQFGLLPWFEPFLASLGAQDRTSARAAKRIAGDTHQFLSLSYAYHEAGQVYDTIPGRDFTQDLAGFGNLLLETLSTRFWPVVSLSADGQTYNPAGGTYGWQWGMDHMGEITAVLASLVGSCVWMGGYELLGPGGNWTPDQLEAFYVKLGSLVHPLGGVTALELGQGYDKWREDGQACWDSEAGQAIDVFLQEFPQPINGPAPGSGNTNFDGCQQLASSSLGPAAQNIAPKNQLTWYQATPTPRGKRFNCALEFALYDQIHNGKTPADIAAEREQLLSLGYTSHG
jgi:hypothetical protein